jgi:hypothetical protein
VLAQTRLRERRAGVAFAILFASAFGTIVLAFVDKPVAPVTAVFLLVSVFALRPHANRYIDGLINWRHGGEAEQDVGERLNTLVPEGYVVMHDVMFGGQGNLDHIASGPNGVYLIETKYRRYEPHQLGRVKCQAKLLHDELGVWVTPVICLHQRRGKPFEDLKVAIVPAAQLLDWLRAERNRPVEFERLARFADRV